MDYALKVCDWKGKVPIKINVDWLEELPAHDDNEITKLHESLDEHGCLDPIDVNADGQVMDGMTRYRHCRENGYKISYRQWKHIESEEESKSFMYLRQLARRNISESCRRACLANLVRFENARLTAETGEDVESADTVTADTPSLHASRKAVDAVSKKTGASERTIHRAVADQNIVNALPKSVKKHVNDPSQKISSKELRKLDECEDIGAIDRELRVGQAGNIREAWLHVTGKPITKTPPKKKSDPKPKNELSQDEQFVLQMKGSQKSIDKIVETIDEWREVYGREKESNAILKGLDDARIAMEQWKQRHS